MGRRPPLRDDNRIGQKGAAVLANLVESKSHRSLPSAATTEAARKLWRVLEMLAGHVERPDSSQPTGMNREFMPTDLSGCRSPLHFMTTEMARRVRGHSQVLMSHIYGLNRSCMLLVGVVEQNRFIPTD